MSVADNIRMLAQEARPWIKARREAAEALAGFRETARVQGINWSVLKSILEAAESDDEDGGKRVKKISEKADLALSYADMLSRTNVAEKNKTRPQSENAEPGSVVKPMLTSCLIEPVSTIAGDLSIPEFMRRT